MVLQVTVVLGMVAAIFAVLWWAHRFVAVERARILLRAAERRWTARRELSSPELERLFRAVAEALSWHDERAARLLRRAVTGGRCGSASLMLLAAKDGATAGGKDLLHRLWVLTVARRDNTPLRGTPPSVGAPCEERS